MHIALIEIATTGHRKMFLEVFSKTLTSIGHNVTILCPNTKEIQVDKEIIIKELSPFPNKKRYIVSALAPSLNKLFQWNSINKDFDKYNIKVDHVIFMWLDSFLFDFSYLNNYSSIASKLFDRFIPHLLNRYFKWSWSGIIFHPKVLTHINYSHCFKTKYFKNLFTLDEFVNNETLGIINTKSRINIPDFTNVEHTNGKSSLAMQIKAKAKGRKIVLSIGSLGKRKSLIQLLDTAQLMEKKALYFVFVGGLTTYGLTDYEINRLSVAANGLSNCYFHLSRVENESDLNDIIHISDIISAFYQDFYHSSNILTKAAYFNKPIIANNIGCIMHRTTQYNLGEIVTTNTPEGIIKAISALIQNENKAIPLYDKYYSAHSQEKLSSILTSIYSK